MNPHTLPSLSQMDDATFLKAMQDYPKPWMWQGQSAAFRYALLRKAQIEAYRPEMPERVKSVEEILAGWNC